MKKKSLTGLAFTDRRLNHLSFRHKWWIHGVQVQQDGADLEHGGSLQDSKQFPRVISRWPTGLELYIADSALL
jgi:hypothetical protein